ncbi:MAG: YlmH/Sll1252 family protein [Oscillospiraceae bacterium]|nr:YlmH/Sll1252 family protein [Oscillospiraceae bacterium]
MNEKEALISKAFDKKEYAADNSVLTYTNFLSMEERSAVKPLERELACYADTFYYGGSREAERCLAVFVPAFFGVRDIFSYFAENEEENPLCLLRLDKDRFTALSHRDYLGALMGLGVKREMIGDITVDEKGCYLFCMKSVAKYICEHLSKIGRGSVESRILSVSEYQESEERSEILFASVPSLRLDSFLAAAFSLSRNAAVQCISRGIVFVNSSQCMKNDLLLKPGDKVVLRGKGKRVLEEILGENKKGRIHIHYRKFN